MSLIGKKEKLEQEAIDPKEMIALEEELIRLKAEHGIQESNPWWRRLGDQVVNRIDTKTIQLDRSRYIRLALSCGWFCGAHRFYAGQRFYGILYLLFCWTGIPFAMTLVDLMIVLPMKPDEMGIIQI